MIIIETTTRERLVLVPEKQIVCTTHTRDATPEDLARGGFVLREQAAPGTLAHLPADLRDMTARAEKAELDAAEWAAEVDALRAEALAELADARRERDTLLAELADAKAECQGAMLSAYAQYAETVRERDEARAELARLAAPAEGEPTDEELHAAWWTAAGGNVEAHRAVYRLGVAHERARQQPAMGSATDEELERVYSNAYARAWESELSTPDRGERAGVLAVAARVRQERCLVTRAVAERDEALAEARSQGDDAARLCGLLATLRAELADAKAERDRAIRDCAATAAERNEARAELARLAAPAEGEPSFEHLRDCWDMAPRADASGSDVFRNGFFALYRLGVAHERARQQPGSTFVQATGTHTYGGRPRAGQGLPPDAQPAQDRATDEELVEVAKKAMDACRAGEFPLIPIALAVAARVRQERCLVTRAVGMLADVSLARHPQRGLGERTYTIRVQCPAEPNAIAAVPAADVPATLARLLGEVER